MSQEQTPGTLTHLATFRLARRAADVLRGLLHEPAWLVSVTVELEPDGDPFVVALVREATLARLMCFPRSIDDVPVRVREQGREHQHRGERR